MTAVRDARGRFAPNAAAISRKRRDETTATVLEHFRLHRDPGRGWRALHILLLSVDNQLRTDPALAVFAPLPRPWPDDVEGVAS
jgi:hypothetical protein